MIYKNFYAKNEIKKTKKIIFFIDFDIEILYYI